MFFISQRPLKLQRCHSASLVFDSPLQQKVGLQPIQAANWIVTLERESIRSIKLITFYNEANNTCRDWNHCAFSPSLVNCEQLSQAEKVPQPVENLLLSLPSFSSATHSNICLQGSGKKEKK